MEKNMGRSWKIMEKHGKKHGNMWEQMFFWGKYGKKHAASTVNERICCLKMV